MQKMECYDLGKAPYKSVWDLQTAIQQRLVDEKQQIEGNESDPKHQSNEVFLFVEHPHVYTLGKNGKKKHLLKKVGQLSEIEADFVESDRGGDITYHGPGQIVGYPIIDMERHFTDIHKYMRYLEEVIIRTCADYGIQAGRIDGLTGVWIEDRKVCALGVRCSRWVTMHGFALNVNTDLSYFKHIIPCGIREKEVTAMQELAGHLLDLQEIKKRILYHFSAVFDVKISQSGSLPELDEQFPSLKNSEAAIASTHL